MTNGSMDQWVSEVGECPEVGMPSIQIMAHMKRERDVL